MFKCFLPLVVGVYNAINRINSYHNIQSFKTHSTAHFFVFLHAKLLQPI